MNAFNRWRLKSPQRLSPSKITILASINNLIGGQIYGYSLGVNALVLNPVQEQFPDMFQNVTNIETSFLLGAVSSAAAFGGFLGASASGRIVDITGRKMFIMLTGIVGLIGSVLSAVMPDFYLLIVSRVIAGLAAGMSTVVCPMYCFETVPGKWSGGVGSLFQFGLNSGITIAYLWSLLMLEVTGDDSWRWMYLFSALISLIQILLVLIIPESEIWLQKRRNQNEYHHGDLTQVTHMSSKENEEQKEMKTISQKTAPKRQIGETTNNIDSQNINKETNNNNNNNNDSDKNNNMDNIKNNNYDDNTDNNNNNNNKNNKNNNNDHENNLERNEENSQHINDEGPVLSKQTFKLLLLGFLLAVDLQLTGVNAIIFFSPNILSRAFSTQVSNISTVCLGIWNLLCTALALVLVDRLGRKPLLVTGLSISAVGQVVLGFVYVFTSGNTLGGTTIAFMAVFYMGFNIGIGSLCFPLLVELPWHSKIREYAVGSLSAAQWIFNFLLGLFFLPVADIITEQATFWIFGGLAIFSAIVHGLFLPETKQSPTTTTKSSSSKKNFAEKE